MIDFDVETDGLQAYSGNQPFLYQFADFTGEVGDADHIELVAPSAFWIDGPGAGRDCAWPIDDDLIQWWLDQATGRGLRAWNSKFDLSMAERQGFRLPPEADWYDGMVTAQLMDERFTAQLKVRGERVLGRRAADQAKVHEWLQAENARRRRAQKNAIYDWLEAEGLPQKRNRNPQVPRGLTIPYELRRFEPANFSHVPAEIMTPYAREDLVLTNGVDTWYRAKFPRSLNQVEALERKVLPALYNMEKRGLPVERDEATLGLDASSHALDDALALAREEAGVPHFNPRSPIQLREALERKGADMRFLKRNAPKKDKYGRVQEQGSVKLDEDGLRSLQHPLAEAVLRFRAENTAYTRYFYPLLHVHDTPRGEQLPFLAPDGRVHTSFMQRGAKTGRSSSMDPNIQNWPRDDLRLRYLVKASPGNVLVTADMEGIEARVASIYTGDGPFRTAVLAGAFHQYTADMLGLKDKQRAIGVESSKQRGKKMNYLVLYGGGVRAIMQWFHVDRAEARRLLDAWHDAYPEVRQLSDAIQMKLARQGYIETILGGRLRLEKSIREEGYKFINYLIQGTASELFKMAYTRLHDQGVPMVGVFHDEVLAEVPEDQGDDTLAKMVTALTDFEGIVTEPVPFDADGAVVVRWSEAKDPEYTPDFITAQEVTA